MEYSAHDHERREARLTAKLTRFEAIRQKQMDALLTTLKREERILKWIVHQVGSSVLNSPQFRAELQSNFETAKLLEDFEATSQSIAKIKAALKKR